MVTQYTAHLRYVLISPSKVRRLVKNLRMKSYTQAIAILANLPHKSAKILFKLIKSAASNALVQNSQIAEESLIINKIYVNEGPRLKRVWRRSRGRADVLLKRMSHISVELTENQPENK